MAKKVETILKLQIPAGAANPSPPVGPALGQASVNIMDFCNAFNAETKDAEKGVPLPVVIQVYEDKSFTFQIKSPPASVLIKKAIKIQKGSSVPNMDKVGSITTAQLEEIAKDQIKTIAEDKMVDLNAFTIDSAMKMVAGTARSMGVDVT